MNSHRNDKIHMFGEDCSAPSGRGFTLVELLVVLAVVGILVALVLSALVRAKQSAESAVCKSNLRQMGIAISMYLADYGIYPGGFHTNLYDPRTGLGFFAGGWVGAVMQYTKAKQPRWGLGVDPSGTIFSCPSYARLQRTTYLGDAYGYNYGGVADWVGPWDGLRRCQLGLAGELLADPVALGYPQVPVRPVRESDVVRPSSMVNLGDSNLTGPSEFALSLPVPPLVTGGNDLSEAVTLGYWRPSGPWHFIDLQRLRHKGNSNILFCDGHVELLKPEQLLDPTKLEVRRLWNKDNQPHPEFPPIGP